MNADLRQTMTALLAKHGFGAVIRAAEAISREQDNAARTRILEAMARLDADAIEREERELAVRVKLG